MTPTHCSKGQPMYLISRGTSHEKDNSATHLRRALHSSASARHRPLLSAERRGGRGRWRWRKNEQTVKYDLWTLLLLRFSLPLLPFWEQNNFDSSERICVKCFNSVCLSNAHKPSSGYTLPPISSSICADFLKGLQDVTRTQRMGLIAFRKLEADLYKCKWIECFFFSLYSVAPVMHLCHFVKLCHLGCFQHFPLFRLVQHVSYWLANADKQYSAI